MGFSEDKFDAAPMLLQVQPVVDLVALGQWDRLLLFEDWQPPRLWAHFPSRAAYNAPRRAKRRRRRCREEDANGAGDDMHNALHAPGHPSFPITADTVESLMRLLREWAPAIMAAASADSDIERGSLEFHLQLPQCTMSDFFIRY